MMSPPLPPSPPEGPPRGTNFSRRKAMHPLPPSPPRTWISAVSMNTESGDGKRETSETGSGPCVFRFPFPALRCDGLDRNDPARPAAVLETNDAGDPRVQRVVLAAADVVARKEPRAPLANDDRAARDELASEPLDPESLGVRVATVARRA